MEKFKLIILSLMMLVCGSVISQTATPKTKTPPQSNKVEIDTSIARKIGIDLVNGDVCKAEIKLVKSNLILTKKEVAFKDSIIGVLGQQKDSLRLIINKKDQMFTKQEVISDTYKQELSKQKGNTLLYQILSVLGVASTLLLIASP